MANNQNSLIRRMLPTAHKVLLDRLVAPRLERAEGDALVIGAGKESYRDLMPRCASISCTDIDPGPVIDIVADAHALPFPDRSFDVAIAIEVFEHLHDPKKAASELSRVLRPGGLALISVPFMFRVHGDPHDYQRFTRSGLEALFQQNFSVEVHPFGNRIQVISDLLTTAFKFIAVFRFINHVLCLRLFTTSSKDCPSGYIVDLRRRS